MPTNTYNYQDAILSEARRDHVPVTVHIVNGYMLKGTIEAFDQYVVVLASDGKQKMIYKHAISTITPSRVLEATSQNKVV